MPTNLPGQTDITPPSSKSHLHKLLVPEELVDAIAKKVTVSIQGTLPVRKIRKSQVLTILLGIVGFSIFTLGIGKLFADTPTLELLLLGVILMVIGGVSLQNTLKS